MSAQQLRMFILQSSQRGMLICQALGAMQQVMDQVQIQQLSLGARGDVLTRYIASTLQVLGLKN